jgi:orotate phosphoribosyltransferase
MAKPNYKEELALLLAESRALFFADGLTLKDGRPTPYFVNFGLFRTGRLAAELGRIMADFLVSTKTADGFEVLVGPSYKGSALAVAACTALWQRHGVDRAFDYDRKEAKTHGEATSASTFFVTGALRDGCRVLIVDDVATTMTTKLDILSRLTSEAVARGSSYYASGVALCLDREQTTAVYDRDGQALPVKGQDAIMDFRAKTGLEVQCITGIREVISFLAAGKVPVLQNGSMAPLSASAVDRLEAYLEVYGV